MPGGEDLPDHAAHRRADDVHRTELERVDQADGVVGHVLERVGIVGKPPGDDLRQGRRPAFDVRREADVAVVEPDHVKAARSELLAEIVPPGDHLRAESHDQQCGGIGGVAEALVTKGDPAAYVSELFAGHLREVWQALPTSRASIARIDVAIATSRLRTLQLRLGAFDLSVRGVARSLGLRECPFGPRDLARGLARLGLRLLERVLRLGDALALRFLLLVARTRRFELLRLRLRWPLRGRLRRRGQVVEPDRGGALLALDPAGEDPLARSAST